MTLECPIQVKVRLADGTRVVSTCMLWFSELTMRD